MSLTSGMPSGVVIAGVGSRFLAAVIDGLPTVLIWGLYVTIVSVARLNGASLVVATVAAVVLLLGWGLLVWWGYATRGQSPGAKVAKIWVLGLKDGNPIGWGRAFLRWLIFVASGLILVIWIILIVNMLTHPRRQGWHDLAVGAVVVKTRGGVKDPEAVRMTPRASVTAANTVGLPPHLERSGFRADSYQPTAPAPSSAITSIPAGWSSQQPVGGSSAPAELTSQVPWDQWGATAPSAAPVSGMPTSVAPQSAPAPTPAPPAVPPQPVAAPPAAVPPQPAGPPPGYQGSPPSAPPGYPTAASAVTPAGPPPGFPTGPPPGAAAPGTAPPAWTPPPGPAPQQPQQAAPSQPAAPAAEPVPARAWQPPEPVEDDSQRTHLAPGGPGANSARAAADGWKVQMYDGRSIDLNGLVLIGRDPVPQPGEDPVLVATGGTSKRISKTHLAIGVDARGPYVVDRGSTNGTAIASVGGSLVPCAAGEQVRVSEGQMVSFGDLHLEIRRSQ